MAQTTNDTKDEVATFAAGCFWGIEHLYRTHFGNGNGVKDARVGYTGGQTADPTYEGVCTGTTGHAEALKVVFDPATVSYRSLVEFFYRIHDATSLNKQGRNEGTNYRSAIFYHNYTQREIAQEVTEKVSKQWFKDTVHTLIVEAGPWWDAEEYHQLYLDKVPDGYHCEAHFLRSFPELR
ncbi:uncharacterized protein PFLUO_LOCUS7821 [Penicillium psychrofluorescens]|uniref:uncharacterized protein n=1 Tax=Penicillium psychrofluorescens TaxID=3158075 RepID=UPI003CCD1EB7